MLAAERASFVTWISPSIHRVQEATWLPCRATQAWVRVDTAGSRVGLLLLLSHRKTTYLSGLQPWSPECLLLLPCPLMAKWKLMVASWDHSQHLSSSMSCKLATPPPLLLLLPICLAVAICNRVLIMPFPFTTLIICMDTISQLLQGWQEALKNWPPHKALYFVLLLPAGPLERGNIFQQGWITACTWSAPPTVASLQPALVRIGSMELSQDHLHKCLCTWFKWC